MTKAEFLSIVYEMIEAQWADSDLESRTEKILTFITQNDYAGKEEDLRYIIEHINARPWVPPLVAAEDAFKHEGWYFENYMDLITGDAVHLVTVHPELNGYWARPEQIVMQENDSIIIIHGPVYIRQPSDGSWVYYGDNDHVEVHTSTCRCPNCCEYKEE